LDSRTAFTTAHSFLWTIVRAPRDVMRVAVGIVVKPQAPGFVAVETQNLK
jgi:multisubunit Na+/H+ antiporter MnhE subunit